VSGVENLEKSSDPKMIPWSPSSLLNHPTQVIENCQGGVEFFVVEGFHEAMVVVGC